MYTAENTLINDIVPLGNFEAIPVTVTGDYLKYPGIVRIGGPFNTDSLYQEFADVRDQLDPAFLKSRADRLIDCSVEEIRDAMGKLGWANSAYKALPMRVTGSNTLLDFIGPYTRSVLAGFGQVFRQQYMLAKPRAALRPHIDNQNCEVHGFKVHIPLNCLYTACIMNDSGEYDVYDLEQGYAYYFNSSRMHFVVNHTDIERVNIAFQLSADDLILSNPPMLVTRVVQTADQEIDDNTIR